jgi:hypothetical protein
MPIAYRMVPFSISNTKLRSRLRYTYYSGTASSRRYNYACSSASVVVTMSRFWPCITYGGYGHRLTAHSSLLSFVIAHCKIKSQRRRLHGGKNKTSDRLSSTMLAFSYLTDLCLLLAASSSNSEARTHTHMTRG